MNDASKIGVLYLVDIVVMNVGCSVHRTWIENFVCKLISQFTHTSRNRLRLQLKLMSLFMESRLKEMTIHALNLISTQRKGNDDDNGKDEEMFQCSVISVMHDNWANFRCEQFFIVWTD